MEEQWIWGRGEVGGSLGGGEGAEAAIGMYCMRELKTKGSPRRAVAVL